MANHQPAEWAAHEAVWIGFPSAADLWLDNLEPAQREVADFARAVYADGRGEAVRLVCASSEAVEAAKRLAGDFATIEAVPFFDIWLRDTGPLIVDQDGAALALDYRGNGWGGKYPSPLDDALAAALCENAAIPRQTRDWVLEGGAIDVDGAGLCVATGQCLLNPNRNPELSRREIETRLSDDLGLSQILWLGVGLANDHTDGHVDNLARFVGPGRLALPESFGDDDPNTAVFADALDRARHWPVEIVTIPSAGLHVDNGTIIPASHMNFYIGNAAVVVPLYGGASDQAAVSAITKLFPNHEVRGLSSAAILTGGGSFHCISQQIPLI